MCEIDQAVSRYEWSKYASIQGGYGDRCDVKIGNMFFFAGKFLCPSDLCSWDVVIKS